MWSVEIFWRALAQDSDDIKALNNKGVELALQKKYEGAMDYFDKVLEIDAEDVAA